MLALLVVAFVIVMRFEVSSVKEPTSICRIVFVLSCTWCHVSAHEKRMMLPR